MDFAGGQPGAWKFPLHAEPQQTTKSKLRCSFITAIADLPRHIAAKGISAENLASRYAA
jgi:hypothetical protein